MFDNIKINGIKNPIGYSFDRITVSFTANCDCGKVFVCVYLDPECTNLVYKKSVSVKSSHAADIDFSPSAETRYYVRIEAGDDKSDAAFFETGTCFDCPFITPVEDIGHPILYKTFKLGGGVKKARLYVTGLGLYEAYVNGKKAGDEYLTPYCNDYDEYVQYQTYDVTPLLGADNSLEIMLGSGWYKGRFGLKQRENIYGDVFTAAAKLVAVYEDGRREEICTDESWSAKSSPIVFDGIYDGEIVDMTAHVNSCGVKLEKKHNTVPRVSVPVVVKHTLKPKLYISPKGENILDFGQNFAGYVSFDCDAPYGTRVCLTAGEVLQDDCFYRENLRTAKARFEYVSDGTKRTVSPHFTFFGARYMLVEGLEKVDPELFTGNVIYSDLDSTVHLTTDNDKINRLLENCVWSQRGNFIDVPTDCPQRDERLGWTGDAEVFARTACYQMDCRPFYAKYLRDMETDFKNYGFVTTYSPAVKEGERAYSVWADAAAIIAYELYTMYGDKSALKEQYGLMRTYVDALIDEDDKRGRRRLYNFGFHLGDWLSQDGASPNALKGATDEFFIASVYYYNSVNIAAKCAAVLGEKEDCARYKAVAAEIKKAVLSEYFTPNGKLSVDTQTAYTVCVIFDIYKDKARLIADFARRVKRDGYKIKGGFVGATKLIQALFTCGLCDEAFRMLYSEAFPSWLYCVNLGATTIWERWNSIEHDGKLSGTEMNSLNHYSYGAVAEAFYAYIAGIRPMTPGFKKALIAPQFNYRLKKLDFAFESASGTYKLCYRVVGRKAEITVSVPPGATALLRLPGQGDRELAHGTYQVSCDIGTDFEHPFSVNTPICDLMSYKAAADTLKEFVPGLYYFIRSNDMGFSGETFAAITSINSFYVPPERVNIIDKQLRNVEYEGAT